MNRKEWKGILKTIETWTGNYFKLMDFVYEQWYFPRWKVKTFKNGARYKISTHGLIENEALVEALKKNKIFWNLCWQKSERGGIYEFIIKELK